MFKSKAISPLLDSIINDSSTASNNQSGAPRPLAISILSSKNGAPLLSSISIAKPLALTSLNFSSHDRIYLEFLDQFTAIDFAKVFKNSSGGQSNVNQANGNGNGPYNSDGYNGQGNVQNYGSINQSTLNSSNYATRDNEFGNFSQENHASEQGTINPFSDRNILKANENDYSPDVITDSHAILELLSHYAFHCYIEYRKDFIAYKKNTDGIDYNKRSNYLKLFKQDTNGIKKVLNSDDRSASSNLSDKGIDIHVNGSTNTEPKQSFNNGSLILNADANSNDSRIDNVSLNLFWFNLEIDHKSIFLHLVISKKNEHFFVLLITEKNYPKGLAKLKLQQLEKIIKESGF